MADDKNLSDDLNDMLGDAKDGAKKAADKVSDKASELADDAKELAGDAKEKAKEFASDAKKTASEFSESAKETFSSGENKKVLAGILAILLGWLGVHKFILGYNKEGAIMAAVGVLGWFLCGIPTMIVSVIGLVEGIMYLTKSDEEFYNTYQAGKKPWF
ncbi:MAG: NINE protein [Algibacter sp.]|uniref:NINE protein n=1 Tax=Algibacter sp. TaxID=1872428 RepID=UPI002605709A|nr:NINE protein [Algibacter sp.]MDG1729641.1 NINE protein [Algibacter sp.]MDG2179517.1 NINE protein [Algibacter sp.]